jgi:hypothetical protein
MLLIDIASCAWNIYVGVEAVSELLLIAILVTMTLWAWSIHLRMEAACMVMLVSTVFSDWGGSLDRAARLALFVLTVRAGLLEQL